MICETCGAEMQKTVEGSTLTWACPSCGDAVARTYIEPIREDATIYSLSIKGTGATAKNAIRTVAEIASCNYLTAKRLIEDGGVLLEDSAVKMRDAARKLEAVGMAYVISPDYPYAISEQ